jgi:hypothetical protein
MCEEYERCQEMVHHWRSLLPTNVGRIKEFESLARQLEAEMARFVENQS